MGDSILYVVFLGLCSLALTFIGWKIGQGRGRSQEGALLGFFLGPLGWVITLILPEGGRKCPECFGVIPMAAKRCKHCGVDVSAGRVTPGGYFVLRDGKTDGPFTPSQIDYFLKTGALSQDALCAQEGAKEWQRVGDIF